MNSINRVNVSLIKIICFNKIKMETTLKQKKLKFGQILRVKLVLYKF